jgi:hypothetical protein
MLSRLADLSCRDGSAWLSLRWACALVNTRAVVRSSNRQRTARGRRRDGDSPRIDLVLYVSSNSRYTHAARRNCEALLAQFDQRRLRLEICDVSRNPERAEEDAVYFTPMLVKRAPLPRTFVVGDLSNAAAVVELLESCGVSVRR